MYVLICKYDIINNISGSGYGDMEFKKEISYLTTSFSLFIVRHLGRMAIAANITAKAIKAGFKFAYAYPFEKTERDKCYKQFCDVLFKSLNRGI